MSEITRRTSRKRKRRQTCRRLRFRLVSSCACVLLSLLLASPVQAITTTFGDIAITPQSAPKGTSSHGYLEYVFDVTNKSEEGAHTVSLSIPFEKYFGSGDAIRDLRRTVQVGAKETVRVSLLQPDHPPIFGMDVAVTIDGRRQEYAVPLRPNQSLAPSGFRGHFSTSSTAEPLILLGTAVKLLPTVETAMPEAGIAGGMGGPPGGALPPGRRGPRGMTPLAPPPAGPGMPGGAMRLRPPSKKGAIEMRPGKPGLLPHAFQFVNTETWSDNWLAYSRYDGIIITAAELNALPESTRTALWQYVETGGALLVLGRTDLRGLSAVRDTKKEEKGWLSVWAGFGVVRVSPDAKYEAWDHDQFNMLMNDWRNTSGALSSDRRNTLAANHEFPVIDDLGIPIKGLFVLMFLFALGIGPVNIFVLSRLKRRIWMLWTTPALSLFTCLAVFGYMLISEGWSGQLRSETLTLLDETTHRATTIGWTGVYSPLTPGDGLHFSYETEVVSQRYNEGRNGGARSCTIDWSQDQHFAAGWVEARVPALFKVRKSELRRERVSLQRERDGRWSMVNGLGAAIRRFWYADAKGQIHEAENVPAGARAMLTPTEKESLVLPPTGQNRLSTISWMSKMKDIAEHPQHHLRPGLYLAEVNDSPFLETALSRARARKLHALIVGFGKHNPD